MGHVGDRQLVVVSPSTVPALPADEPAEGGAGVRLGGLLLLLAASAWRDRLILGAGWSGDGQGERQKDDKSFHDTMVAANPLSATDSGRACPLSRGV